MSQLIFFEWTRKTIDNPTLLFPNDNKYYIYTYEYYSEQYASQASYFYYPLNYFTTSPYTVAGCNTGVVILQTNETFLQVVKGSNNNIGLLKNYYLTPLIYINTFHNKKRYLLVLEEFAILDGAGIFQNSNQPPNYACNDNNDNQPTDTQIQTSVLLIYSSPFNDSSCFKELPWTLEKIVWSTVAGVNISTSPTSIVESNFVNLNIPYIEKIFKDNECIVGKNILLLKKAKIIL